MREPGATVTLSMIVRNESGRYLRRMLEFYRDIIDAAVIIDDNSTDDTPDICREVLQGIPLQLIQLPESQFMNEYLLRMFSWSETGKTNPDWILCLDSDEIFEEAFKTQIEDVIRQTDYDAIYFRLYDMWSETHYRDDAYWRAHQFYQPFLVRYRPGLDYVWKETPVHCGRLPLNIKASFTYLLHPARLRHYGWAKEEDRIAKYNRYLQHDPGAKFGWQAQYDSILDPNPNLVEWG